MTIRVSIILVFIVNSVFGQDTVFIKNGFQKHNVTKHFRYFNSNSITAADSALNYFLNYPEKTFQQESSFIGIVQEPYWLLVNLKNLNEAGDFIFEIEHSHLRHIDFYEVRNNETFYRARVGELYPFYDRPILHRHFVFPIELSKNASVGLLLYVRHINTLALPSILWSTQSFYRDSYNFNLAAGTCIGFLIFCSLFSLIAFLLLRKSIFGWYAVYLFVTTFYLFADLGFAFQYLFPGIGGFDGALSIYSPLLMFSGLVMFILEFLSVKEYFPTARLFFVFLVFLLLFLIVVDLIFQESWRQYTFYILPVVFSLICLGLVVLFAIGVLSLKTDKRNAQFFIASYSVLIVTSVISIFGNAFGFVIYSAVNIAYIGVLVEVSILSVALMIQYRDIQNDRLLLQKKLSNQQTEMYRSYIEGIEKERNRIAGDLHDDIGSRLSHLQRMVFHDKTDEYAQMMEEVINSVRVISHDLSPTIARVGGLQPLVEKLIHNARKESGIDIKLQLFDFKEVFSRNQIIQLYRILQEALNNVVKHSDATRADIQLFGHSNEVHLSIEDNGKGFDAGKASNGLGIYQMRIRTESLSGHIEINSYPGKGTLILIQIPLALSLH